jgi:hypothetical protein
MMREDTGLRTLDSRLEQQLAPEPMQFRFPPAHPARGQQGQRLGRRLQPLGGLSSLRGRLGEQRQVIGAVPRRSRRSVGDQGLTDLYDTLLPVPTCGQRPAPQGSCPLQLLLQVLLGGQRHRGLRPRLGERRFAPEVMEYRRNGQG